MTKTGQDYLRHFQNQTWNLQGPEMVQAMLMNLEVHKVLRPETMWHNLPKIKECIVVGAGPSLKKNAHHLNGCGVPLLVTDRALPEVWKHNQEDIFCVTNLESTAKSLPYLKKWWGGIPTEGLRLVAPTFLDPLVSGLWKGETYFINPIFVHGDMNRISERVQFCTGAQGMTTGSNVGVMTVILAYNLGCKRIALVGMDHVEYEKPAPEEMYVRMPDVNGTPSYLWWNFYMGQWEIRYLAKTMLEGNKIEFWNCTEGGILYDDWIRASTLEEFLTTRSPITETDTEVAAVVIEGDKTYIERSVQ